MNPLPLVDGDLELVAPAQRWIEAVLSACRHPATLAGDPEHASLTRAQLQEFLELAPGGHDRPQEGSDKCPCYHFWMRLRPECNPPVPMAGSIALRIGHGPDLELYFGHIGYNVYPPARGRHYAERACRLLLGLARVHGLDPLWITTDPSNAASRRTCERLGAVLVDVVNVPPEHVLYSRGQKRKCRYRLDLNAP